MESRPTSPPGVEEDSAPREGPVGTVCYASAHLTPRSLCGDARGCFRFRFWVLAVQAHAIFIWVAAPAASESALEAVRRLSAERKLTFVSSVRPEDLDKIAVDFKGPEPDVLAPLLEAGLVVFENGTRNVFAIVSDSRESPAEDGRSPAAVVASRLVESLPTQLIEKRELGFVPCQLLNVVGQDMLYELLGHEQALTLLGPTPGANPAALADLFLGVWLSYFLVLREDRSVAARIVGVTPQAPFFASPPEPLALDKRTQPGSLLWWLWPYTRVAWAEKSVTGLKSKTYALTQLLEAISSRTQLSYFIDERAAANYHARPIHLFVGSPDLGSLLWGIEVASGLQLRTVGEDPPVGLFTLQRRPSREMGPECWTSLPARGYRSPLRTAAGAALIMRTGVVGNKPLPLQAVWALSDLPPIYEWGLVTPALKKEGTPVLRKEAITLIWAGGLELRIEKRRGAHGVGFHFDLPVL